MRLRSVVLFAATVLLICVGSASSVTAATMHAQVQENGKKQTKVSAKRFLRTADEDNEMRTNFRLSLSRWFASFAERLDAKPHVDDELLYIPLLERNPQNLPERWGEHQHGWKEKDANSPGEASPEHRHELVKTTVQTLQQTLLEYRHPKAAPQLMTLEEGMYAHFDLEAFKHATKDYNDKELILLLKLAFPDEVECALAIERLMMASTEYNRLEGYMNGVIASATETLKGWDTRLAELDSGEAKDRVITKVKAYYHGIHYNKMVVKFPDKNRLI